MGCSGQARSPEQKQYNSHVLCPAMSVHGERAIIKGKGVPHFSTANSLGAAHLSIHCQ